MPAPDADLRERKLRYQDEAFNQIAGEVRKTGEMWRDHFARCLETRDALKGQLEQILGRLHDLGVSTVSSCAELRRTNAALRARVAEARADFEVADEEDAAVVKLSVEQEGRLTERRNDLQRAAAAAKARLDLAHREKVEQKKAYARALEQYQALEAQRAVTEKRRRVLAKREEAARGQAAEERTQAAMPRTEAPYRALLAAAGHGPALPRAVEVDEEEVFIPTPISDSGTHLENNIRALLSTGNYTESDSVIVALRQKLKRLRGGA